MNNLLARFVPIQQKQAPTPSKAHPEHPQRPPTPSTLAKNYSKETISESILHIIKY